MIEGRVCMYILIIMLIILVLFLRTFLLSLKSLRTPNTWLLGSWLLVLFLEFLSKPLFGYEDLSVKTFWLIVTVLIAQLNSALFTSLAFRKNREPVYFSSNNKILNHKLATVSYLIFLLGGIIFIYKYITLIGKHGFYLNIINSLSKRLVGGITGYLLTFGLVTILLLNITKVNKHIKYVMITSIIFILSFNPRRGLLITTVLCVMFSYLMESVFLKRAKRANKRKLVISVYLVILIVLILTFFTFTQYYMFKSYYFRMIRGSYSYPNAKDFVMAFFIDPLSYFIGSFNASDQYLSSYIKRDDLPLQSTFYSIYTIIGNFDSRIAPTIPNPFIKLGNLITNTVPFAAYFFIDAGYVYTFIICSLIFIIIDFATYKYSIFSLFLLPYFYASNILSFRQNNYVMITFLILLILAVTLEKIYGCRIKRNIKTSIIGR